MEQFARFPSFEPMFTRSRSDSAPAYLCLLNLFGASESRAAIEQVRTSGQRSGSCLDAELGALLSDHNWRPQLVGAVALLVFGKNRVRLEALWAALDRPCWVSPQLAAVASLTDPDFDPRARERIDRRCALDIAAVSQMGWPSRHSALGPESFAGHSKKLLSALMRLCEPRPGASVWLTAYDAAHDIKEMIATDFDRGGDIATGWSNQITALLSER